MKFRTVPEEPEARLAMMRETADIKRTLALQAVEEAERGYHGLNPQHTRRESSENAIESIEAWMELEELIWTEEGGDA